MKEIEVIRENLVSIQVCTTIPPEKSYKLNYLVEERYPAGTSTGWYTDEKTYAKECDTYEGRWHYVLVC
jgi:hypothetical protein